MIRKSASLFLVLSIAICLAGVAIAKDAPSKETKPKRELAAALKPLIDRHEGEVAIAIKNLKTGESFEYKSDKPMPTASLIKFPVMIATYEALEAGKVSLGDMIEVKKDDMVPGSGLLTTHFSPGLKLSLRDATRSVTRSG
jgi:beta-lactamase class A